MPRVVSASNGQVTIDPRLRALARSGWVEGPADRLIPLPAGATLMHLPGRRAVGNDASGGRVVLDELAVAAVLPPGYLRTRLPAYEEDPGAPVLPLYGYAAVASVDGMPHVA